jgi:serine/alanine adding enzyme
MRIIRELNREAWSDFVFQHPEGNVFQTPEMYDVCKSTKNYEPHFLGIVDDDGGILAILVAVLQREYSSFIGGLTARSVIWGGPLVRNDDVKVFRRLLDEYDNHIGKHVLYSQFRNLRKMDKFKSLFLDAEYRYEEHMNVIIDLSKSEETLWKELHSKRRNEIRRARREGTYVRELVDISEIEQVYDILSDVYNDARIPFADRSMFLASYEILRPKGLSRYLGAFNNGKLIGAICLLAYKKRIYDWYAGSSREYLKKYPNDLLPWEVFKWGMQNGYVEFDFGGAGKPNEDYGVRDYKRKFGGDLVNFGRFQKIHKPFKYAMARAGYNCWRCLKSSKLRKGKRK